MSQPGGTNSFSKKIFYSFLLLFILVTLPLTVIFINNRRAVESEANSDVQSASTSVIRGVANDLWADAVVGKRDFSEIAPNEVVPYKTFRPGGTVIDRSITPGRLYVWDGGNNRILGLDLASCYASNSPCSADIIIGQATGFDTGACNRNSSFDTYPVRPPASASTLCGIPEITHTTLEDKSHISMHVDSTGALYVPDSFNNRVLRYDSPFTTDTQADEVWGQTDFSGNGCNITGWARSGANYAPAPPPTASSLCFHSINGEGSAVTFDSSGNMWIADGGNNRVLRFPKDISGTIAKTADLVLGQPDFTTGGDFSNGSSLDKFSSPQALVFDATGKLYVADAENNRVLSFSPPFTNKTGTIVIQNVPGGIIAIENDPQGRGIWTRSNDIHSVLKLWSYDGQLLFTQGVNNYGAGGFGFDSENNILLPTYDDNDVFQLVPQGEGQPYLENKNLFSPPRSTNLPSERRFPHPAWGGIAVADNQLIVAVNHLKFWNGPPNLEYGKTPDGFVGVANPTDTASPEFGQLAADLDSHLWVSRQSSIEMYQTPLVTGANPVSTLSTIDVLGGGQITLNDAMGVAVTPHSEYLWVAENSQSRVFRIRNPLTTPLIDVILGQTSIGGTQCNRGLPERDPAVNLTMLCSPGMLSLDKLGNLYVADTAIELEGNFRMLMFSPNLFPGVPSSIIFAPSATKEFPISGITDGWDHIHFQAAFDSTNRMVVGSNPYTRKRFIDYYNNPVLFNPLNPSDPNFARPDGELEDFYGWPIGMVFDSSDNLYVYDANRGQARIYLQPFGLFHLTPTVTPTYTPTPTSLPTPTRTPTPTPSRTPTPRPPTPTPSRTPTPTKKPTPTPTRAPTPTPTRTPTPSRTPTPTRTPTPIPSHITITALSTASGGTRATMKLDINGVIVATWNNVPTTYTNFSYTATRKLIADDNIKVRFTNDQNNANGDRNLRVDKIVIDTTIRQSEDASVYGVGARSSTGSCSSGNLLTEWLNCNGYFQYILN